MKFAFKGCSMKIIFAFIFIALAVLCTFITAQEYTTNYWLQKGEEFFKNDSYDLALRCYEKAIEIKPQDAEAWYNKGIILKKIGRTTEANVAFAKAKELTTSKTSDASSKTYEDVSASSKDRSGEYLKTIFVSKEGYDGITIYFILADKNGVSIKSDGKLDLSITDEDTGRGLFSMSRNVTKSDFVEATLGLGAFAHKDVILNIGRIPYSDMKNVPGGEYAKGIVKIKFTTPKNKVVSGKETVYFN